MSEQALIVIEPPLSNTAINLLFFACKHLISHLSMLLYLGYHEFIHIIYHHYRQNNTIVSLHMYTGMSKGEGAIHVQCTCTHVSVHQDLNCLLLILISLPVQGTSEVS